MKKLSKIELSFLVFLAAITLQFGLWLFSMSDYDSTTATPITTLTALTALGSILAVLWFAKNCVDEGRRMGVFNEQENVDN